MDFPTPDDPKRSPVWENYVIAQATQAALRQIPVDAHALGVEVHGPQVTLVLQAPTGSPMAEQNVEDIVSELEALLGQDVAVASRVDARGECRLDPSDGVAWFFASRA